MPMDQFEDNYENFDIEDFDEEFEQDFEPEVEGEYELSNNEYQDFDDVSQIPPVDFSTEKDDDEEDEPPLVAEEEDSDKGKSDKDKADKDKSDKDKAAKDGSAPAAKTGKKGGKSPDAPAEKE